MYNLVRAKIKALSLFFFLFPNLAYALILSNQVQDLNQKHLELPALPLHIANDTQPQAKFTPAKVLDNFDGTSQAVATWWDGDGTQVYNRDLDVETARSGFFSMSVKYIKRAPKFKFSFFAFQPQQDGVNNDFSKYQKLSFYIKSEQNFDLLIKIEDKNKQSFEQKSTISSEPGWQLIEFNLKNVLGVDLSKIENVFFFVEPGKFRVKGEFLIDDIYLISEQEIPRNTPPQPQIESFDLEDDIWILRWQNQYDQGAMIYEIQASKDKDFKEATIFWTNNDFLEFYEEPEFKYYRVRAWNQLPEYQGKSSPFSEVWQR